MLGVWRLRILKTRQSSFDDSGDKELQHALDRLSQHAFEHGLYDCNEMPEGGGDE